MSGRPDETEVAAAAHALYAEVYQHQDLSWATAVERMGLRPAQREAVYEHLEHLGLIRFREGEPLLIHPERAVMKSLVGTQAAVKDLQRSIAEREGVIARLVENYVPLGPGRESAVSFSVMTNPRKIASYLDAMVGLAHRETLSMHPGPLPPQQVLEEGLERDREIAERGLMTKAIYLRGLTSSSYYLDYLRSLGGMGYNVRVATTVPLRMLIADRQRAVIPVDPQDVRAGAIAIDGASVVRSLAEIFDYCWQESSTLDSMPADQGDASLSPQEHAVIRMLASGVKDEAIARGLGVSGRTVSRMISEVMLRLNVVSRFQMGVEAGRRGWLD